MGTWIRNRYRGRNEHRDQEAQSRKRWGHASLRSPLGAAHARRRTFADAIVASALSMLPSLRHPGFARPATPALGHGQPLASSFPVAQVGNPYLFAPRHALECLATLLPPPQSPERQRGDKGRKQQPRVLTCGTSAYATIQKGPERKRRLVREPFRQGLTKRRISPVHDSRSS
jgi:hypothetical protein